MAVKTCDLFPKGVKSGFFKTQRKKLFEIINKKSEFLERSELENDESYQQIIPQIVLKVRNKVFIHKITQKSSENRLVDMYPIFLGGHVDEGDLTIEAAADREFDEEIDYRGKILSKKFQGIVKLDDNSVNKVHTGFIWIYEGDNMVWHHKDEDLIDGRFVNIKELNKYEDRMTYWSKMYLPALKKFP